MNTTSVTTKDSQKPVKSYMIHSIDPIEIKISYHIIPRMKKNYS